MVNEMFEDQHSDYPITEYEEIVEDLYFCCVKLFG